MRNLKKFLALVLAMLMVSACAVSVSAVYSDQAAVNASGYAEAIAALSDLRVMQGSGDGSFNPNGTLTRVEAAVIAAKLVSGAKGQSYEWTSSTCQFADVDAAWSFAYINYVAQRNIMTGDGTGAFKPNGTLQVDEAITLAVKATSAKKTSDAIENTKTYKPTYWATYWINAAEELGLLNGIEVFDYEAPCTRAMMAQIGYNMLSAENGKIAEGFGLETITAEVLKVTDVVELSGGAKVSTAAFNNALKATGADITAADIKGCKVTLTYSSISNAVYGVSVDSVMTVYTYADAKIENVLENNVITNQIKVDGITYNVKGEDVTDTSVIGGTTSSKGINVTVEGEAWTEAEKLPTYFKAVAFDDDADGDCDRLAIATYSIATAKVVETNSKGVVIYEVPGKFTNNQEKVDEEKPVVWTGAALVTDNETPMLIADTIALNDAGNAYVADILETAAVVSGKLVGIGSNYVNIDGTKYSFVTDASAVETWTLNQNVSVYTIGGQYVKVASASKTDIEVVVNSVVVTDGKAVVTGYNKSAGYADITITVEGVDSGRLISKVAKQYTAKDAEGKEYNTAVAVGHNDSSNNFVEEYKLTEGTILTLRQTDTGAYIKSANGLINAYGTADENLPAGQFEVKNGYVYINDVASKYVASGAVILEEVVDANAKTDSYAKVTYNKLSAFAARKNVNYRYTVDGDGKVNFIYVVAGHEPVTTITKTKALAEGQAIVFVKDASVVEANYAKTIYNAINLMTGEKVEVSIPVSSNISVISGKYYIINSDNVIVENTTDRWMGTKTGEEAATGDYTVTVEYSGLVGVVKAQAVVKTENSADKSVTYAQEGDVLTFGLDNITIYNAGVLDGDGNVSKADVAKTLMTGETHRVSGDIYVVAGQMIIVLK